MKLYVLHVQSMKEEDVLKCLLNKGFRAYVPKEIRLERRGGTWHQVERIIMTGYVFVEIELTAENYYSVKAIPGIIRFLGAERPEALKENEETYIRWLSNDGKALLPSDIQIQEDNKVVVISGALKGHEGRIISIDKRQKRATVGIELMGQWKEIVLSVNVIQKL